MLLKPNHYLDIIKKRRLFTQALLAMASFESGVGEEIYFPF